MHTQSIIIHRPRLLPATYTHTQLACITLYPDAHAGWLLLMLHSDNFNICHWTEGVDLQQHPDPNKDPQRKRKTFFFLNVPAPASLRCWCSGPDSFPPQTRLLFSSSVLLWFFFSSPLLLWFHKSWQDRRKGADEGPPSCGFYLTLPVALWGSHERKPKGNVTFVSVSPACHHFIEKASSPICLINDLWRCGFFFWHQPIASDILAAHVYRL